MMMCIWIEVNKQTCKVRQYLTQGEKEPHLFRALLVDNIIVKVTYFDPPIIISTIHDWRINNKYFCSKPRYYLCISFISHSKLILAKRSSSFCLICWISLLCLSEKPDLIIQGKIAYQ